MEAMNYTPELRDLMESIKQIENLRRSVADQPFAWGKLDHAGSYLNKQVAAYFAPEPDPQEIYEYIRVGQQQYMSTPDIVARLRQQQTA
jgi:hypothetical protein